MKNMKISKNASFFAKMEDSTPRIVGKLIADFISDMGLNCNINWKGDTCTVELLEGPRGMRFQSKGISIKDNEIRINEEVILEELSNIFIYLKEALVDY